MNAGCAGKTVRSLENACHTWAPWRCVHDKALYKSTFTFTLPFQLLRERALSRDSCRDTRWRGFSSQSTSACKLQCNKGWLSGHHTAYSMSLTLIIAFTSINTKHISSHTDRHTHPDTDRQAETTQRCGLSTGTQKHPCQLHHDTVLH